MNLDDKLKNLKIEALVAEVKDFKERIIPSWKKNEKLWNEQEIRYKTEAKELKEALRKAMNEGLYEHEYKEAQKLLNDSD